MTATVGLADWKRITGLPYFVLLSFQCEQGKLYEEQLSGFITQLAQLAQAQFSSLQGQLLDDALKEGTTILAELKDSNPSALLTGARQAIHAARRALDGRTFQGYLSAMLRLHRSIEVSLPLHARLMRLWVKQQVIPVVDSIKTVLEEATNVPGQTNGSSNAST